jgi:hypothetical protein
MIGNRNARQSFAFLLLPFERKDLFNCNFQARKFLGQLDRLKKEVKDEAGLENFKAKLKSLSVNVRQLEDQQFKQRDNEPQVRCSNKYLQIQLFKSDFGEVAQI